MKVNELRKLAQDNGYYLHRGDAYGCAPAFSREDLLASNLDRTYDNKPCTLERDGRPVLVAIKLSEVEGFLLDGTVPEGHVLGEDPTALARRWAVSCGPQERSMSYVDPRGAK